MFSHIMVGSNDLAKAKTFYDAVLGVLGAGEPMVNEGVNGTKRLFYMANGGMFGVAEPIDGQPATFANGGTIGFACASAEQVDKFHEAGVAAGGTSIEDPPGLRGEGPGAMYLCYLRDPDGNKLCGFHRPG